MQPVWRFNSAAAELVTRHPPQLFHPNKTLLFEIASPEDAIHAGHIGVSRWSQVSLPDRIIRTRGNPEFVFRDNSYRYAPSAAGEVDWYLNLSLFDLFCCYGGEKFGHEEKLVVEHPALASVRHEIIRRRLNPWTVENEQSTPILISGVERRCSIATPSPQWLIKDARPLQLDSSNFYRASEPLLRESTRLIDSPTISNVLALEDFSRFQGVSGDYTGPQIESMFLSFLTGFRATKLESSHLSSAARVIVHSCGPYPGSWELSTLLQLLAACSAGIDRLVFHSWGATPVYGEALGKYVELLPPDTETRMIDLLIAIERYGYSWEYEDDNDDEQN